MGAVIGYCVTALIRINDKVACSVSLLILKDQEVDPVPVQTVTPELFCFALGSSSTEIS
jgi:hypothetical protein